MRARSGAVQGYSATYVPLEISAEVLIERTVFVAKGRDGGHPWLVLSSDLARFERALTATE
jgi:hypothetical protein